MKKTLFSMLSLLLACATGCLATRSDGEVVEKGRLQIFNPGFASQIEVIRDQTTNTDSGFLKVQVTLRNTDKRDFTSQYQFIWKDSNGMELTSAEILWKPLQLHGREETIVEGICPVPKAADYRLVLRPLTQPR